MLANYVAIPTIPVADLQRARDFYENVLDFQPVSEGGEGIRYRSGDGQFLVYPSDYAGTNEGTAMAFQIPHAEFDAEVTALREKGLEFLTFDAEGMTWDEGVATFGEDRGLWFEDPDGNILAVETH